VGKSVGKPISGDAVGVFVDSAEGVSLGTIWVSVGGGIGVSVGGSTGAGVLSPMGGVTVFASMFNDWSPEDGWIRLGKGEAET